MADFDILVVGGGLAGMSAALACHGIGRNVAIIAKSSPVSDGRTTALFMPAITFLDHLNVWKDLEHISSPLKTIRLLDGTKRLIRSRPASFHASDIGLDAFGYNIPNSQLLSILTQKIREKGIPVFKEEAVDTHLQNDGQGVLFGNGDLITATQMIAADGRHSIIRKKAGISHREWHYRQKAIVLTFRHKLSHDNISTEFHTEKGPFTQVPLPNRRSSLVWAIGEHDDRAILNTPSDDLNKMVENGLHSILGAVHIDSELQCFPISGLIASRFGKGRIMLIGESAHAFPPIGAQGLNLTFRDIISAVECLKHKDSVIHPDSIGQQYEQKRRADIFTRTLSVDMFNRMLLTSFLPIQLVRSGVITAVSSIPSLRKAMMHHGVMP